MAVRCKPKTGAMYRLVVAKHILPRFEIARIDVTAGSIDLIWAEGSIYVVGMKRALAMWRPRLRPGACVAFSDFVQWTTDLSKQARAFWAVEFPDMASRWTMSGPTTSSITGPMTAEPSARSTSWTSSPARPWRSVFGASFPPPMSSMC